MGTAGKGLNQPLPDLPPELTRALEQEPAAKARFTELSPSHQREHISYVAEAKKLETRERRATKTVETLLTKR